VLKWGNSSSKAKNCQKIVKKYGQKLSKSCRKAVKKLSKSCQKVVMKVVKNGQKIVKKSCQKAVKSCQKVVKKLKKVEKKKSKSCQKVVKKFKIQQTVVGGGVCVGCRVVWYGEILVPRPLASASLTGQRQKTLC
jgi:gamma-glutamylcysteine synthetase